MGLGIPVGAAELNSLCQIKFYILGLYINKKYISCRITKLIFPETSTEETGRVDSTAEKSE